MRQAKVKVEDPEAFFQTPRMASRYMRYIITALLCFTALFFLSTHSASSKTQLQDASDRLLEKLGQRPVPAPAATAVVPFVDDPYQQSDSASTPSYPYENMDTDTTPNYPHNLPPPSRPGERMNATFVTLARNQDVWDISKSIRQVEDRFNRKFNYDWVFLNDKEFDDTFKKITTSLVSGKTKYGLIPEEHWSFPSWIDQNKAAEVREDMKQRKIIYGDSISYRHMCRFESGFFFQHPLMQEYEWYWRVEPSIELFCDIEYDAFKFMADNNKKYSFTLSLYEYIDTIPTLWDSVQKFMQKHPEHIAANNSMGFLSDDGGKTYNKCHFWSNFEIGNLNWLRSDAYTDFFKQLDEDGGFFYERWGDAPVHSIAAGLTLPKDQIHFFNDIAYYHVPFTHCPLEEKTRMEGKCHCNPQDNFDWHGYSCTARFFELHGMEKPEGAPLTDEEKRNRIILWIVWISGVGIALMAWIIKRLKRL